MHFFVKVILLLLISCSIWSFEQAIGKPRIIGGEPVFDRTFDGVVAITYKGQTLCSGSLVTKSKIITAAHCILPIEEPGKFQDFRQNVKVYTGNGVEGGKLPSQHDVKEYWVHPKYRNHPYGKNDIAVIELRSPVKIKPLELLKSVSELKTYVKASAEVLIMGFGFRENTINNFPTQNKDLIGLKYQTKMSIKSYNSNEIYLTGDNTGPCTGDSGGPAFVNINNRAYLIGVASRVSGKCGHSNTGAFYGLITDHTCWLSTLGIELSSFKQMCGRSNFLTKNALSRVVKKKNKLDVLEINLSNQYINTIDDILNYPNLEVLNIEDNKLNDLRPLRKLKKLRVLKIAGNNIPVKEIKFFSDIVSGENKQHHNHFKTNFYLTCESQKLGVNRNQDELIINEVLSFTQSNSCLEAHIALKQLSTLDLSGLGIHSIDILKGYNKFNLLYLDDNNLSDLSIIQEMTNLETLYFSNNKVSDLSFLKDLDKLQYVDASNNSVINLNSLNDINYFLMINLNGNNSLDKKVCLDNKKIRCL